jgi:hypothetical protein
MHLRADLTKDVSFSRMSNLSGENSGVDLGRLLPLPDMTGDDHKWWRCKRIKEYLLSV